VRYSIFLMIMTTVSFSQEKENVPLGLQRRVESIQGDAMSLRHAFVQAMLAAQGAGGIAVLNDCNTRWIQVAPAAGSTANEVMESIVASRPDLMLETSSSGMVHVVPRSRERSLLDSTIHVITIRNVGTIEGSLSELLRTNEIQAEIKKYQLKELPVRLGFSGMSKSGYRPGLPPLTLSNVTFREALDSLALAKGNAVWVYIQTICGAKREFEVSFDVK
jgi:hypothetical protein